MKLTKDNLNDQIILHLKEREYFIVLRALKAAATDEKRDEVEYNHVYSADKADVLRLLNEIIEAV